MGSNRPVDPDLTLLRLKYERLARAQALVKAEWDIVSDRLRKAESESNAAFHAMEKYARSLGWCVICEKPIAECSGHAARAGLLREKGQ
jgi:hypothetical protein